MNFIFIYGKDEKEFNENLKDKVESLNSFYFMDGIKTIELETMSEIILSDNAPIDDEEIWMADYDFALLYKRELDEKYIEIIWAKNKWVIGKTRTQDEIDDYMDNETIDNRIFFVEQEKEKIKH